MYTCGGRSGKVSHHCLLLLYTSCGIYAAAGSSGLTSRSMSLLANLLSISGSCGSHRVSNVRRACAGLPVRSVVPRPRLLDSFGLPMHLNTWSSPSACLDRYGKRHATTPGGRCWRRRAPPNHGALRGKVYGWTFREARQCTKTVGAVRPLECGPEDVIREFREKW